MRRKHSEANEHGFNAAVLGITKENPYPPNTINHQEWEWGWNEGEDVLTSTIESHSISNEYEYF